jgi:hypothetical protein
MDGLYKPSFLHYFGPLVMVSGKYSPPEIESGKSFLPNLYSCGVEKNFGEVHNLLT